MDGVAVADSEEFEVCGKEKQAYSERECCLIQCLCTESRGVGAVSVVEAVVPSQSSS